MELNYAVTVGAHLLHQTVELEGGMLYCLADQNILQFTYDSHSLIHPLDKNTIVLDNSTFI